MAFPAFAFLLVPFTARAQTRQSTPAEFKALAAQAAAASEQDRIEDAIILYTKALVLRPKWAEGWWSLGTLEYDHDQYARAALDFEKVIALDAANGTARAMLGLCQFELGQDEAALKNLLAGQKLGVQKDQQLRGVALYHLGVLELRARKFGDARVTLGQLVKQGVKTKEVRTALGMAVLMVRPAEATDEGIAWTQAVESVGEAETLLELKDFERAKQTYADLTAGFPDFPNLHFAYGRFLLEVHETEGALAEFQRELKGNPADQKSLLEIAAVLYQTDSAEGVKYAKQAVQLDPQRPFGHYLLGLLYADMKNVFGAISELEIAKRSYTNLPEVYFALGNAYARAGRKAEAARARATFTRLNAQRKKKSDDTVYDEYPRGLTQEKLGAEPEKNPPEL
jgi:tetratricopeptide (TPR) repeat protein